MSLLSDFVQVVKVNEITGVYQCGYQSNRLTADAVFCIYPILEEKWEYSVTVHQPCECQESL
jgi:hypothetical protein